MNFLQNWCKSAVAVQKTLLFILTSVDICIIDWTESSDVKKSYWGREWVTWICVRKCGGLVLFKIPLIMFKFLSHRTSKNFIQLCNWESPYSTRVIFYLHTYVFLFNHLNLDPEHFFEYLVPKGDEENNTEEYESEYDQNGRRPGEEALCPIGSPLGDPGPLGDLFVDLGPL